MPSDFFAVNGRVVPAGEATISVLDLGFLRGVGAFETFRTYDGHPHALAEHLARIWESAASFGQKAFFDEATVRRVVREIRERSGHAELRVNMIVTPGSHGEGVFGTAGGPTWVVIARDVHAPPESAYENGVTAVTFASSRHLPTLKTTSYLSGKKGLELAAASGAHEAFYVDDSGYVTEGVTSNVLTRVGNRVMTPTADCLPGITKAGVRPIAESLGLTWYECRITRDDVYNADEVWITSAVREVLPIVRVDGRQIADGRVGTWGRRLRAAYRAACFASARADAERA
jgi:branched-subunit amino acid aminotransferase/4-amino-4-deoxychorismate lyase